MSKTNFWMHSKNSGVVSVNFLKLTFRRDFFQREGCGLNGSISWRQRLPSIYFLLTLSSLVFIPPDTLFSSIVRFLGPLRGGNLVIFFCFFVSLFIPTFILLLSRQILLKWEGEDTVRNGWMGLLVLSLFRVRVCLLIFREKTSTTCLICLDIINNT